MHAKPVALFLAGFGLVAVARGCGNPKGADRSQAVVEALARKGLSSIPSEVLWVREPVTGWLHPRADGRALVRAHAGDEPSDLYLVRAVFSPEGRVLAVDGLWNITHTHGVDESAPVPSPRVSHVAYTTNTDGLVTGVHGLNLDGLPPSSEFTRVQQWQLAIAEWQQTGQREGVVHQTFGLDPVASEVHLHWEDDERLSIVADGRPSLVDAIRGEALRGAGWLRVSPVERAAPGNLTTWAVNRVRAISWFGDDKMFALKAVVFTAKDYLSRLRGKVLGENAADSVAEDLGTLRPSTEATFTDPELGWPPAPLAPILSPPLAGEGHWIALDQDPFIRQAPGLPAAFVTTFLRADKERADTRVYVTLWDPRQVALHMEAGTIEPVSATGEAGPGVVPRAPEVITRLVGGFNGGFQAMHGEYGMQANGILYLPPKPYAATVLELRDGSTALGAWPRATEVPDEVLSYRQNMTALVQNDKFNPWGRTWWGGTPPGWTDTIHTTRSGVCLTKENFVGYLWGNDLSAEALAKAMLHARCSFGVHLDMNPGLAGFEFYNVRKSADFAPLGRTLQSDWETEGTLKEVPDIRFRARRMVRTMNHQHFPQYIHRDARDFFYLTLRSLLPGAPLGGTEPDEGVWKVKGLPQHGFPYALATTWIRPEPARADRVWIAKIDPRTVLPAGSPGTDADTPTVATFESSSAAHAEVGLVLRDGAFQIRPLPELKLPLARGHTTLPESHHPVGAVGVQDEDGILVWLELRADEVGPSGQALLERTLSKLGCGSRMWLTGKSRVLLGGAMDLRGEASTATGPSTRLVRTQAAGARSYFDSTEIVPITVWQPLQLQRVRYFPKKKVPDAGAP